MTIPVLTDSFRWSLLWVCCLLMTHCFFCTMNSELHMIQTRDLCWASTTKMLTAWAAFVWMSSFLHSNKWYSNNYSIIIIIIKQEFSALSTSKNWADKALHEYTYINSSNIKTRIKKIKFKFSHHINKTSFQWRADYPPTGYRHALSLHGLSADLKFKVCTQMSAAPCMGEGR